MNDKEVLAYLVKQYELGSDLLERNEVIDAILTFEHVLEIAPSFFPAHIKLAWAWLAKEDAHSAINKADWILAQPYILDEEETQNFHCQAFLVRAVANQKLSRWFLVERDLLEVLKCDPNNEAVKQFYRETKEQIEFIRTHIEPQQKKMPQPSKSIVSNRSSTRPQSSYEAQATYKHNRSNWVKIPSGSFTMGSHLSLDPDTQADEMPMHQLTLPYTYYIGKYPVTVSEFTAFVKDTGHNWDTTWLVSREDNHPVTSVNWLDCVAYCEWLTHLLHTNGILPKNRFVRLPTEAEWEQAARGADMRKYPWGNQFDANLCNSAHRTQDMYKASVVSLPLDLNSERNAAGELIVKNATTPVGMYSPQGDSPFGCADMAGNVHEWTHTLYDFPYPYQAGDGREDPLSSVRRVVRGGSWKAPATSLRVSYRARRKPFEDRSTALGFRVILAPDINDISQSISFKVI